MPDNSTDWDDEPAPPEGWPSVCEMADVSEVAGSVRPAMDVGQSADYALSGVTEAEQGGNQPRLQRAIHPQTDGGEGSRRPEPQVAMARRLAPGMRIGLPLVLIICAWFSYGLVVEHNSSVELWVGILCAALYALLLSELLLYAVNPRTPRGKRWTVLGGVALAVAIVLALILAG